MDEEISTLSDELDLKKLGQGNTAEIYQYEEGKILKLFRKEFPFEPIKSEYHITKVIEEKNANIPKAYHLVKYKGRYGIIYEQIKGMDMIKLFISHPFSTNKYARKLAHIQLDYQRDAIDVGLTVKDKLTWNIREESYLTDEEKDKIINYLNTLPDGDRLCHFDFHPGNIMFCGEKSFVIDWMTACTGNPIADVTRSRLLLSTGEMMHMSPVMRAILHSCMKKIGRIYIREYIKVTGVTIKELDMWLLPVAAARLTEWLTDHEREKLITLVRAQLELRVS